MNESDQNPDRKRRPKSLWELMGRSGPPPPVSADSAEEKLPRLKSLWKVMGEASRTPLPTEVTKETTETPLRDQDTAPLDTPSSPSVAKPHTPLVDTSRPVERRWKSPQARQQYSHKAVAAIVLGGGALLLSFLALVPGLLSKLPALTVGFGALFAGFLSSDEIKTSRGRLKGARLASAGIGLGVLGMFLGPTLAWTAERFAIFGYGEQKTRTHLQAIGDALNRYHDVRGLFPAGGRFDVHPDGRPQPMHGWMSTLLPYLGHERLHRSIKFNQPFDAPANAVAMRKQVPEFLAAGVEQKTSVKGFGATHFAGVGGEWKQAQDRTVHLGVFDRNSRVRQDDVSDGVSQTLVAGEIPSAFPAWGEPENWRPIGKGLNREPRGFGNAAGGATLFLMADGSVRSFAPNTDPELLRKLSTRDGGE